MQNNPIQGRTNDARDRLAEAAVLALHPTHLSERELSLDLAQAALRTEEVRS
jgi:hypothetical protein